ncbi:unnamed protein product, partial [Brassica oleracea var. botrytis]
IALFRSVLFFCRSVFLCKLSKSLLTFHHYFHFFNGHSRPPSLPVFREPSPSLFLMRPAPLSCLFLQWTGFVDVVVWDLRGVDGVVVDMGLWI